MKIKLPNFTKRLMAVAAVFSMATSAFAGDIPGAANAKVGDIGRHETASDVNEWVNPENGVYGLHVFAVDENPWDSQFFIVFSDKVVPAGTPIDVKFDYRKAEGSGTVKFNAQGHADPHAYVNNDGWGELEATEDWQTYEGSFEASGEIRTLAVNASIGRENGTLYMRNIVIECNYDEVVVTKETTADEADMEEAPIIEVPEVQEPLITPPSTIVDYAKIGMADASDSFIWSKQDESGKYLPKPAKYDDDIVLAFKVDTSAVNHWDVSFHVDLTSYTFTDKAILSFEYKDDYEVGGNMWWHNGANQRHDGLMPWDGAAQLARGMDWLKFEDALVPADSLYEWEIQLGPEGKKPALAFNTFIRNLTLTIDGKEVYNLSKAANPVKNAIAKNDNLYSDDGLIFEQGKTGLVLVGCFNGNVTNVTIPNTVTKIADGAFYNCTSLTNVTIPESVTSIGNNAFHNCTGLKTLVVPKSVTSIGTDAFKNVKNVINISKITNSQWGAESLSTMPRDTIYVNETITKVEYVHDTLFVFRSVSVNDQSLGMSIYPNPTSSFVTVECDHEFSYVLTTSAGSPLRRGEGSSTYVIDLSDYADGVYLLYSTDGALYTINKE